MADLYENPIFFKELLKKKKCTEHILKNQVVFKFYFLKKDIDENMSLPSNL